MRRFAATQDEARAIISQTGTLYQILVKNDRISGNKLELTRGIKKGVFSTPIDNEGYSDYTQSDQLGVPETPKSEAEDQKGVLGTPRSNKDSDPIESSKERESPARTPKEILGQHRELAYKLIAICGYKHPKFVVNGKLDECANTISQLVKWAATLELLDEFPGYWWGDNAPTFKQVVEYWGKFLEWREKPKKQKGSDPANKSSPPINKTRLAELQAEDAKEIHNPIPTDRR